MFDAIIGMSRCNSRSRGSRYGRGTCRDGIAAQSRILPAMMVPSPPAPSTICGRVRLYQNTVPLILLNPPSQPTVVVTSGPTVEGPSPSKRWIRAAPVPGVLAVLTQSVIVQVLNYARFSRIFPSRKARSTFPTVPCPLLCPLCSAGQQWNPFLAGCGTWFLPLHDHRLADPQSSTLGSPLQPTHFHHSLPINQKPGFSFRRRFSQNTPKDPMEGLCFLLKMDGDREETTKCKSET
ncbi:hypothetical protein QBC45DRAFT_400470 [Copromyces sp. CBS 386.78]|nr:hypothetical protein QBC45DRAFT_400470 [Copromyces sp. CBS 386.78]